MSSCSNNWLRSSVHWGCVNSPHFPDCAPALPGAFLLWQEPVARNSVQRAIHLLRWALQVRSQSWEERLRPVNGAAPGCFTGREY